MDYGQSVSALKAAHEGLKECLKAGRSADADGMLRLVASLEVTTTAAAHKENVADQALNQKIHDAWASGEAAGHRNAVERHQDALRDALGHDRNSKANISDLIDEVRNLSKWAKDEAVPK